MFYIILTEKFVLKIAAGVNISCIQQLPQASYMQNITETLTMTLHDPLRITQKFTLTVNYYVVKQLHNLYSILMECHNDEVRSVVSSVDV